MMTCLLPTHEVEWLQSEGLTPGVAIAKLRGLMSEQEDQAERPAAVGMPPDLWARFERIGAAINPPISALDFLLERAAKAEQALKLTPLSDGGSNAQEQAA